MEIGFSSSISHSLRSLPKSKDSPVVKEAEKDALGSFCVYVIDF